MRCDKCKWWEASVDNSDIDKYQGDNFGYCRRNAPDPTYENNSGELSQNAIWPITETYDWCGEFVKK